MFVILLTAATATPADSPWQPLADIRMAAETHARGLAQAGGLDVEGVQALALDNRLRLPVCTRPLEADGTGGRISANMTLTVRCPATDSWVVRVPVRLEIMQAVLVTSRSLARGDVVQAGDFRPLRRAGIAGQVFFGQPSEVIGRRARRPIPAGTALMPHHLDKAALVRTGDRVRLVSNAPGVEISMEGLALTQGGQGDSIRVRNLSSQRVLQGVVSGPGEISVQ